MTAVTVQNPKFAVSLHVDDHIYSHHRIFRVYPAWRPCWWWISPLSSKAVIFDRGLWDRRWSPLWLWDICFIFFGVISLLCYFKSYFITDNQQFGCYFDSIVIFHVNNHRWLREKSCLHQQEWQNRPVNLWLMVETAPAVKSAKTLEHLKGLMVPPVCRSLHCF